MQWVDSSILQNDAENLTLLNNVENLEESLINSSVRVYLYYISMLFLFSGKDCGFPGRPGNGTTIGAEKFFYPGEEVTFQCDNGFILFGGDRRICQEDGSWSGSLPECSKTFLQWLKKRGK